jgi:hypothetical protein
MAVGPKSFEFRAIKKVGIHAVSHYNDFRQALSTSARLDIPMPLASMANQIQEMGRTAAMGNVCERFPREA